MAAEDLKKYMDEIVDPTIRDFEDHPASRRHAFIASVVTFHCVDYLAHPKNSANLRDQLKKENPDFADVDRLAHSFKHVLTGHPNAPDNQPLRSSSVFERPPGFVGVMAVGLSFIGDEIGAVEIWGEENRGALLPLVKRAAEFLRSKIK
jgi:hypothetical protein